MLEASHFSAVLNTNIDIDYTHTCPNLDYYREGFLFTSECIKRWPEPECKTKCKCGYERGILTRLSTHCRFTFLLQFGRLCPPQQRAYPKDCHLLAATPGTRASLCPADWFGRCPAVTVFYTGYLHNMFIEFRIEKHFITMMGVTVLLIINTLVESLHKNTVAAPQVTQTTHNHIHFS